MARSSQQVFEHHRDATLALDLAEGWADYADDSASVTLGRVFVGREATEAFYAGMLENFPNITVSFDKIVVEDDTVLLLWPDALPAHSASVAYP